MGLVEVLIETAGLYMVVCAQYATDLVDSGLFKALTSQEIQGNVILEMHTNKTTTVHQHAIGNNCSKLVFGCVAN